jgi:hypothetical protein
MRRLGNCPDSAVAENCFGLLNEEPVKRKIWSNQADAFDCVDMF